jgi:phosphoglycolate phosphatase
MKRDHICGLLFDKDGTLLDYDKTWVPINREVALIAADGDRALANEILAAGGHDPSTDKVQPGSPFAAAGIDGIVDLIASVLGPMRTPANLYAQVETIFRDGGARSSILLPHVRETLIELQARGYVLGLFAFKCGCDSGFGAKPEPGMVHAFAGSTGLPTAAIAVIGDSTHDLHMARHAGAGLAIAVLSGTGQRADLAPHADLVLPSVADVLDVFPGVRART